MAILPRYRTPQTLTRWSDGAAAGRLIAKRTGKIPTYWQQYVLDVALERMAGPGSPFAYSTVDVIVGRRGGKTITLMGVPLFRALCGPVLLDTGDRVPFTGAHTAQNLVKARQRFMKDLVEPYRAGISDQVWQAGHLLRSAIGDTSLTLDPIADPQLKNYTARRASNIQVFAPTLSSVRGDGLLHLGFDEVLVFTAQRGEELMAAARPTLSTMRGHGQIWRSSNVTTINDQRSWLYQIRDKGRAAVEAGRTTGTAYFEFSIPDDEDPADEASWWRHHPALGDGLLRPEELRTDLEELGLRHFAAEYLGRWPGALAINQWTAIAEEVFTAARSSTPMPDGVPAVLAADVDPYGRSSSIAAAVEVAGAQLVEVVDHRPGSDWVLDQLLALAGRVQHVALDDYGAGHDLYTRLAEVPDVAHKLMPLRGPDLMAACYSFDAGLREGTVHWVASDYHQRLVDAASAAERTAGRAWQWERRVGVSQTPLMAATLARWAAAHAVTLPDPEIF